MDAEAQARFDLIASNLQEFLNPEIIEKILIEKRSPRVYWGTATTGLVAIRQQKQHRRL